MSTQSGNLDHAVMVAGYVSQIPEQSRVQFNALRQIVRDELPQALEVVSYGILGYKIDDKRPKVFISGFKDHVGLYPIPADESLRDGLRPYVKGKGTLWFPLGEPLPKELIIACVRGLAGL